jgi:all-trans-retinol 13,14-reductase
MQHESIIIIGGGIGGLFCGAILSKEGYRVTIFEKHAIIGGGLHQFKREGIAFETGMHVVGAFDRPDGVLHRICSYLGIRDCLSVLPEDRDCYELFHVAADGKKYRMHQGAEAFVEALGNDFPAERANIARYLKDMYAICDEVKLYNLKHVDPSFREHPEHFLVSVGSFIDSYTSDPRLRKVLAFSNPLYAGEQYHTPVYVHALISKLYIEGACRFVGGSQQLADALCECIRRHGGEVFTRKGITHVEIAGKQIAYVETADGQYRADWYISSIHPASLFRLLDKTKLQRSYWSRIESIPSTYSAYTLYIIFKPYTFPFFNYTYYYQDTYQDTWEHHLYTDENWPRGLMFMTPPRTMNDTYAEKMIVNCIMNYDTVRAWENTTPGKRGEAYKAFKRRCEQRVIDKLQELYPDIRSCIQSVYSASPLSIRDFCDQKEGALYGVKKDCEHIALSHIPVRTKLQNLLLTGQNVSLHGILGVPLTALKTCAELTGLDYLLDRINNE